MSKLNWKETAELLAMAAIVASLLFVGLQLKQAQDIGAVNWRHFSFMGHILKHHIDTLMHESAPAVAAALKKDEVDIAILTPA
jgi:hypothetical protein